VLFSEDETEIHRVHPVISQVPAPPLDFATCCEATADGTLIDAGTLRDLIYRGLGVRDDLTTHPKP